MCRTIVQLEKKKTNDILFTSIKIARRDATGSEWIFANTVIRRVLIFNARLDFRSSDRNFGVAAVSMDRISVVCVHRLIDNVQNLFEIRLC